MSEGWLRQAIERAAWDALAASTDTREFAHLWAWEREMREPDAPYDWSREGL